VIMAWLTVPDTLRKDGKKVSSPKLSPVQGKTPNLV